jgi:hypothetical protein
LSVAAEVQPLVVSEPNASANSTNAAEKSLDIVMVSLLMSARPAPASRDPVGRLRHAVQPCMD